MKTLTRLGSAVSVETEDGSVIDLRGSLLYDETGGAWPSCSLLIAGFSRVGSPAEPTKFARRWSKEHEWRAGSITLPPRSLNEWSKGPRIAAVNYTREPDGEDFTHPFGMIGGLFPTIRWPFSELPVLYRRGSAARVESSSPFTVTSAGII